MPAEWTIELKSDSVSYTEAPNIEWRNVLGNSLASVEDYAHSGDNALGSAPGVLRFTVEEVGGGQARITAKTINIADKHHPGEDSAGKWVDIGGTDDDNLFPGLSVTLTDYVQVGDIFEIGLGYTWDGTDMRWLSIRAFGVVIPGWTGNSLYVKVRNTGDRPIVWARVSWETGNPWFAEDGGPNFFWVNFDGTWHSYDEAQIYLNDENGISGLIDVGNHAEFEIRPEPDSSATADYNMVNVTILLQGTYI